MTTLHTMRTMWLKVGVVIYLALLGAAESLAQVPTTITSSGLNTQVSAPSTLPSGQANYNITGGTRPGGGTNLFHSFGEFSVGSNGIANFLNETALPTNNILGRVTGGNPSHIFGTLQTTGFGSANLFLVNPAGVVFGPTASLNVGGSLAVTTANYVSLADGARFNAIPSPADALLSTAPIAAFGFLGSNLPAGQAGMVTVQPGATLTVSTGQTISLLGRDNPNGIGQQAGISVIGGSIEAELGRINLVSVGAPSAPTGGEVTAVTSLAPPGFKSLGTVVLKGGTTVNAGSTGFSETPPGGTVWIRAGALEVSDSSVTSGGFFVPGGSIDVSAKTVKLDNATISSSSHRAGGGQITFRDLTTMNSVDSEILAAMTGGGSDNLFRGGSITIGSTETQSITLADTHFSTSSNAVLVSSPAPTESVGHITVTGKNLMITGGGMGSTASPHSLRQGGTITLNGERISLIDTSMATYNLWGAFSGGGEGGPVTIRGLMSTDSSPTLARSVLFDNSAITVSFNIGTAFGGRISVLADNLTLNSSELVAVGGLRGGTIDLSNIGTLLSRNSRLDVSSAWGKGGTILLGSPMTQSINLTNTNVTAKGGLLSAFPWQSEVGDGGQITIATKVFRSDGSVFDVSSAFGNGGRIDVHAKAALLNQSNLLGNSDRQNAGQIRFAGLETLTSTNSSLTANESGEGGRGLVSIGSVETKSVQLTATTITTTTENATSSGLVQYPGISITAKTVNLNGTSLDSSSGGHDVSQAGTISLNGEVISITNQSALNARDTSGGGGGGLVRVQGLEGSELEPTAAKSVVIKDSSINTFATGGSSGRGGEIAIQANSVSLTSAGLNAHGPGGGGTVNITASKQFQSLGGRLDATSSHSQGGSITIRAGQLSVTDGSILNAEGTTGPGSLVLQADKKLTIKDSAITPAPTIY